MSNKSYSSEIAAAASQSVKERDYWLERLSGAPEKSGFPYDSSQPGLKSRKMETFQIRFPEELFSKLMWISNESDARLMMLLAAGLLGLLNKYSGSKDIIVGMPIYKQDIEGDFINTALALRTQIQDNMTFRELLYQVKQTIDAAIKNQNYPLRSLLYELNLPISEEEDFPLFDIIVLLENIQDRKYIQSIHTNMIVSFSRAADHLECTIEYNRHLYYRETIRRIAAHLFQLLQGAVSDVNAEISRIELLSEQEREKLLQTFNENRVEYPNGDKSWMDKSLYQLFEEQVEKNPDNAALVFEGEKQTYREYNEKANRMARFLRKKGVGPKTMTALLMENSIEMVVAVMAILKAGGAYLPIDMDVPEDRKTYILNDSGSPLLLVNDDTDGTISASIPGGIEIVNACDERIYTGDSTNLEGANRPSDLAYVIYTSGSTGKPKGVLVEHRQAVNTLVCRKQEYKMTSEATALQLFSYAFDGFVTSFFTPIISGARVVLLSKESIEDIEKIVGSIVAHQVTHFISVPILYQVILANITEQEASSLKVVTLAGDRVQPVILDMTASKSKDIEVVNEYGITEAAVMSTIYRHQERDLQIKIGRPIWNNSIYITRTGDHSQLTPIGVYGEMCIAGAGTTRGYMNKPDLTVEKFVENPFVPGQEMLKTGDLAKWLPDGNIVFGGRRDFQVKIRGFRIELGEIEQELLKHEAIREVVVTAGKDDSGDNYLCAYLVSRREIGISELREYLSASLSDYMIPPYFVFLDHLPLTASGKVDRKQLPPPEVSLKTDEYVAPRDDTERELVDLWADVLGVDKEIIGIDSNFFELGGHSLTATILGGRIHKEFNIKLPMTEVFRAPMIRSMSQYIKSAAEEAFASIFPAEEREYYPLSSAQKRLYLLQNMASESTVYNIYEIFQVEGEPERERLKEIFWELIRLHESLRTSFHMVDRTPVQKVHPSSEIEFDIEYHDPGEAGNEKRTEAIVNSFVRAFDLSQAPLIQVGLVKIDSLKHVLMVDMHHIISDGVSHGILIDSFLSLYRGSQLLPLRLQYKDYSQWRQSPEVIDAFKKQERYWMQTFAGEIPVLSMPTDYSRPAVQSFEGSEIGFVLSAEETQALDQIGLSEGATLFMLLLAIFNIVLSKISSQEDIVVGTPIAGRKHADLEQIIGMFVNTLALRSWPSGEKTFKDFLAEVKEKSLEAFKNQDYPFEDLVDQVDVQRNMSRNPLFDIMFVLQNIPASTGEIPEEKMGGLNLTPHAFEHKTAKFDLSLTAVERGGILGFTLEYCTKLFKKETMVRIFDYLRAVISEVVENPKKKIAEIDILPGNEKDQVLHHFNAAASDYPGDKTIHRLFEEQAEQTPDRIAIVGMGHERRGREKLEPGTTQLTFREVNETSNQWAHRLRARGVEPDTIVGVILARSVEMITVMLGIIKAGAAYLAIDIDNPTARIRYMLADSGVEFLITDSEAIQKNPAIGMEIIPPGDEAIYRCDKNNQGITANPKHLFYVIYTSGTTGNPKGVLIRHRGFVNMVYSYRRVFGHNSGDRMSQVVSPVFDAMAFEIWPCLLNGAALHIADDELRINPAKLKEWLIRNQVTLSFQPTLMAEQLLREDWPGEGVALNVLQTAGDRLTRYPAHPYPFRFYNLYGPTESTVWTTWTEVAVHPEKDGYPAIGKPIGNNKVYIVGCGLALNPIGVPGELCISGEGVARGYLNRPELTDEKFIDHLFEKQGRLYRTGDLARWLSDGSIEFLGRVDQQVKIRGVRIELGEIESCLSTHEAVKEAVVLAKETTGPDLPDRQGSEKVLHAYIVPKRELTISELRQYLSAKLSDYMIPSYFVEIGNIPVTPGGKVDRKALESHSAVLSVGTEYVEPESEMEKMIADTWKEILNADKVGIDDNFFDLGGNSLKAIQLTNKMNQILGKDIPVVTIFEYVTIRSFARYLSQVEPGKRTGSQETDRSEVIDKVKKRRAELKSKKRRAREG